MLSAKTGAFNILRNQAALPQSLIAAIQSVRVQNEINVPSMFSFVLDMVSPSGAWQGANLDSFKPGDEITVLLGLNSLQELIVGEITAIEPSFGDQSTATIRGFDRMYRLHFGTWTRDFKNLTDKDIVQDIAESSGINIILGVEEMTVNSYVKQNMESNYDFLLRICGNINFELVMEGTSMRFRSSAEGLSPIKTLNFPRDMSQVDLTLKVPTKGCHVTVCGFDPATNQKISAVAASGTVRDRMGGRQTGYEMAGSFPDSSITVSRLDLTSVEALQAVADAQYQLLLDRFIEGSATLRGDPALTAGVNIGIAGLSSRFDGTYYIAASTHRYDDTSGYQTEIAMRRTGA